METIDHWLGVINGYVWGWPLVILLFGTHLFLTVRLRFIQRHIGKAIRLSLERRREGEGDISHFGALTTALAATIGTGNIVGVATAVAAGGPGAVLWMWLTGVFGISTKYAEAVLSVKYRVTTPTGQMAGGPMYVLERGMNARWLGLFFAVATALAAFGIGNMVQAHAISALAEETFHVPMWATGVGLAILTAVVIIGGIRSIASVCERLVPLMAIFYVIGCLALLVVGASTIPATIALIVKSAFTGQAAAGAFLGVSIREVMRYGIARGLFSNESGLGSAPIVAAAAQTKNPVRQALVSATGTFWDTVVVCAITGIVIVNSGEWMRDVDAEKLTHAAFGQLHHLGPMVLTIGLFTFVFSTILGWSYYGEKAAEYVFGSRVIMPYRWLWVTSIILGALGTLQSVWGLADLLNAFMAVPNLIALIVLSGVAVAETRKYLWTDNLDLAGELAPVAEELGADPKAPGAS
jgi:AGCS family alanine or glycine:cation symporter